MKKKLTRVIPLTVLAAFLYNNVAVSGTATTTFQVSAIVLPSCSVTADPLSFGNYDVTKDNDATNTITVTCSNGTAYNVGLSAGNGTGATIEKRIMTANGGSGSNNALNYTIYRDSARSQLWGNTIGTDTLTGTGDGKPRNITGYGRIFASQFPSIIAGNTVSSQFTDSISVTVTY